MANEGNKVIYSMIGVSKVYDKKPVLKDIYLSYFYGAKIGVIGLNGSGKSSLLKILAGVDDEFLGKTILSPGYTVGYLEQEPRLDEDKTVRRIVEQGVQATMDVVNEYNAVNEKFSEEMSEEAMAKLVDRQAALQEKMDALDAWDIDSRLEMAMDALRCPPGDTPVKILSGGERRRVALCRLLLQKPDILLLDEPTNHLDAESVAWLEHHLQKYEGTIIAVTHDRYFLDNVAGWILELDRGQGIPWQGNYSSWLEQKQNRLKSEEKSESARIKTLERELEWIRMSPKGRHAKSKARIKAYEALLDRDLERESGTREIFITPGPRLGDVVIEAEGVSKGYGEKLLVEGMTFSLPPGGIVGVIGPNGAGKTTLFNLIAGTTAPQQGEVLFRGRRITAWKPHAVAATGIARTFQTTKLFPHMTVQENVMVGRHPRTRSGFLAGMLNLPRTWREDRQTQTKATEILADLGLAPYAGETASNLSFGRQRLVEFARALATEPALLLLDEPAAGLNIYETQELSRLILKIRDRGVTCLIVEHDMSLVMDISDEVVVLDQGQKIAEGPPAAIQRNPDVIRIYLGDDHA